MKEEGDKKGNELSVEVKKSTDQLRRRTHLLRSRSVYNVQVMQHKDLYEYLF